MVTGRALVALLAACAAGVALGRALPRSAARVVAVASTSSSAPSPAPERPCKSDLATTRAQLAICLAYRAPARAPEPAEVPAREAREGLAERFRRVADAEQIPQVLVRHRDGTVKAHVPEDWPADNDEGQIIARTGPDGRPGYYAPDAGPDAPELALRDLTGPDGWITGVGGVRVRFRRPDAGTP